MLELSFKAGFELVFHFILITRQNVLQVFFFSVYSCQFTTIIIGLPVAKTNLKMSGTVCGAKRQNGGAITLPVPPKMGHLFKLLMGWVVGHFNTQTRLDTEARDTTWKWPTIFYFFCRLIGDVYIKMTEVVSCFSCLLQLRQ